MEFDNPNNRLISGFLLSFNPSDQLNLIHFFLHAHHIPHAKIGDGFIIPSYEKALFLVDVLRKGGTATLVNGKIPIYVKVDNIKARITGPVQISGEICRKITGEYVFKKNGSRYELSTEDDGDVKVVYDDGDVAEVLIKTLLVKSEDPGKLELLHQILHINNIPHIRTSEGIIVNQLPSELNFPYKYQERVRKRTEKGEVTIVAEETPLTVDFKDLKVEQAFARFGNCRWKGLTGNYIFVYDKETSMFRYLCRYEDRERINSIENPRTIVVTFYKGVIKKVLTAPLHVILRYDDSVPINQAVFKVSTVRGKPYYTGNYYRAKHVLEERYRGFGAITITRDKRFSVA